MVAGAFYLGRTCRPPVVENNVYVQEGQAEKKPGRRPSPAPVNTSDISQLTNEENVVAYFKKNRQLPDYYITKNQAKNRGWNPGQKNLCDVLPGKAIGGDVFTNRQKILPSANGRIWYEADLNYNCGQRNADRLLYSSDGLIFVTHDHYKTFDKK